MSESQEAIRQARRLALSQLKKSGGAKIAEAYEKQMDSEKKKIPYSEFIHKGNTKMKCEFCKIPLEGTDIKFDGKYFCSEECSLHYEVALLKKKITYIEGENKQLKENVLHGG